MEKEIFTFNPFSEKEIIAFTTIRDGETKLGQKVKPFDQLSKCKFVIIGINEDIGPQANIGLPGSKNAFNSFITRFLNTQSNRFLIGEEICIAGEINVTEQFSTIERAREIVSKMDNFVTNLISPIIAKDIIPIVVGGGHNNAYPLIKSSFKKTNSSIDVINLDPHADCRPLEGRHSGNPFSSATHDGYLNKYSVLGLHQQYNSESIYEFLDFHGFEYSFYEDYIDLKGTLFEDLSRILNKRNHQKLLGVEIDMDSIAFMPSSAYTPSGISIENVRLYIRQIAKENNICYLHLPESAPLSTIEEKITGKTLTYIVLDFIKARI
jgi:formiminoglutamase